jgi:hypothetical protein
VRYLPPFELIRRLIEITTVRGELRVNVSYENFVAILRQMILRQMIQGIAVDEAWYVCAYEDIGNAVEGGLLVPPNSISFMTAISKGTCRFRSAWTYAGIWPSIPMWRKAYARAR